MIRAGALIASLATLACAQEFQPGSYQLGSKVADFSVQDLSGKDVSFDSLKGPITVITFIATQCPVSNAYNQRMNAVYKDYSAKGVKFIFVNANRTEPASEVAEHASSVGFAFPVFKDPNNRLADRFDAQVTPESYVIDQSSIIRYHGQVDDSQNEARVKTQTLRLALDALLAGKPVPIPQTKAFGCTIKRVRRAG